jgi:hypothetical protein
MYVPREGAVPPSPCLLSWSITRVCLCEGGCQAAHHLVVASANSGSSAGSSGGLGSGQVAGIVFAVLFLCAAIGVALFFRRKYRSLQIKYTRISIQSGDIRRLEDDDDVDLAEVARQRTPQSRAGGSAGGSEMAPVASVATPAAPASAPHALRFDDINADGDDSTL